MPSRRDNLQRRRFPLVGLLALGLAVLPLVVNISFIISLMVLVALYAIIAMGFDILAGYAGQVSLGQAAFVGLSGYTTAYLTTRLGWEPLLGIAAGLALTLMVAYFLGLVTLGLPKFYFPLATMGLSVIFQVFFISLRDITGGPSGFTGVPDLRLGGLSLNKDIEYYYFSWCLAGVFLLVSHLIVNSAIGRAFRAIERDELAASMMGVDVAKYKMMAFLISVGYASIGGSMLTHYMRFLSPDVVGLFASFSIVSITVVGGMGSLVGVFLGAALLKGLPEAFTALKDYMLLINGFAIVAILIFMPQGLMGGLRSLWARWETSRQPHLAVSQQDGEAIPSSGSYISEKRAKG
jgi:branched-chain amino acid transport system permease protein